MSINNNTDDLEDDLIEDEAGEEEGATEEVEENEEEGGEEAGPESEEGAPAGAKNEGEPEPTRGQSRQAKLSKELKVEREARIRAEALAEERARTAQPVRDNGAAEAARNARLESMTPEDRREFLRDEALQNMQQNVLLTQLQTQDALDKNRYEAIARSGAREAGAYTKHAAEVERRLSAERNQGRNWPRETILAQIIGEAALKSPTVKPAARRAAAARVDATTTRPMSVRSNATTSRRGKDESFEDLEARLSSVVF